MEHGFDGLNGFTQIFFIRTNSPNLHHSRSISTPLMEYII